MNGLWCLQEGLLTYSAMVIVNWTPLSDFHSLPGNILGMMQIAVLALTMCCFS